jgi:hypothetical protein
MSRESFIAAGVNPTPGESVSGVLALANLIDNWPAYVAQTKSPASLIAAISPQHGNWTLGEPSPGKNAGKGGSAFGSLNMSEPTTSPFPLKPVYVPWWSDM